MAETATLKDFLVNLGFKIDESAQRRFTDSVTNMRKLMEGFSSAITGAAVAAAKAVAETADHFAKLHIAAAIMGGGETIKGIEGLAYALNKVAAIDPSRTVSALTKLAFSVQNDPTLKSFIAATLHIDPNSSPDVLIQALAKGLQDSTVRQVLLNNPKLGSLIDEDIRRALNLPGIQAAISEYNKTIQDSMLDPDKLGKLGYDNKQILDKMILDWDTLRNKIAQEVLPVINQKLIDWKNWIDNNMPSMGKRIEDWGKSFEKAPDWIKDTAAAVYVLSNNIGNLNGVLDILGGLVAFKVLFGIGRTVGSTILGAGTAILSLLTKISPWIATLSLSGDTPGNADAAAKAKAVQDRWDKMTPAERDARVEQLRREEDERRRKAESDRRDSTRVPTIGPVFGAQQTQEGAGQRTSEGPSDPNKPGFFEWIWSHTFGVSAADAAELPRNVKTLTENVATLNDTMTQVFLSQLGLGGPPGGPGGPGDDQPGGGAGATKVDPETAKKYVKYLMDHGMGMLDAAATVAGLGAESGLNPNATNPISGAYGMEQTLGSRKTALLSYARMTGRDANDPYLQLDYLLSERQGNEHDAFDQMSKASGFEAKLRAFIHGVERPGPVGEAQDYNRGVGVGRVLMGNTSNLSMDKTVNISQTNNTNINGATDPTGGANSLKDAQNYHNRQLYQMATSPVY